MARHGLAAVSLSLTWTSAAAMLKAAFTKEALAKGASVAVRMARAEDEPHKAHVWKMDDAV